MGATWSNSNNINSTFQEKAMDKKLQKVFQDLYGFDKNKDIGDQQALLDLYKEYKLLKKSNQQLEKMHHKLYKKYSSYENSKGIFSSETPQQQKQMIQQANDVVKGVKHAIERGQQIPVSQVNDTVHNLTTIAQQAEQQAKQAKQQGNVTQAQNAQKRAQQAIKIAKTLQGVV
jgi:uncharacterized protein (DUF1697 family)